jgi:hypothetical protein
LSSFDLWYYIKKLNILKVIKALKKINPFKRSKAINISRQATSVWFKGYCAQYKDPSLNEPVSRCKSMSSNHEKVTLLTAGGHITCLQCNAKSKRTGVQCRIPASKGKTKCRFHGGLSRGAVTEEGRQRCAEAKTIHGNETRKARTERTEGMRRLRALEDLGHALGIITGSRTCGRKPG